RTESASHDPVERDRGVQPRDLLRAHLDRLVKAAGVLDAASVAQRLELLPVRGEPEVAGRPVAGIDARLRLEAEQLLAGEERQADVDRGRVLRPEAAGRASGAAAAGHRGAVDHQDVADA